MRKVYKMNTKIYDTNKKITEKYNALNKVEEDDSDDDENIIEYPKRQVSLQKFRIEEARRSNTIRKKGSSFLKLFGKRLDSMEGERKKVSITLYADIKDISNKFDLDKLNENIEEKTYGPFTMDMPKMSKNDMYKFMMYTLLDNNFTILSAQVIDKIGCKIITYDDQNFMDHRMGKLKLQSYLLCKQKPIKSHGKNTCAVDYVWDQVKGKRGFKTYDYDKLKSEIYSYVYNPPMINTEELINWVKNCHHNVSIHAYDSTYRKFISHTSPSTNVSLVYIVKDHHCFPITNEKLKLTASKASQSNHLLKYMSDLKWTRRHENIYKMKKLEDLHNIDKENNIIILPEGVKIPQVMEIYMNISNLYIEFLHWSTNGILDGFIDHNKKTCIFSMMIIIRENRYVKNCLIYIKLMTLNGQTKHSHLLHQHCSDRCMVFYHNHHIMLTQGKC